MIHRETSILGRLAACITGKPEVEKTGIAAELQ
jgi:hypothetical protein